MIEKEPSSGHDTPLLSGELTDSGYEFRRANASDITDPFVSVNIFDNTEAGHPYTRFAVSSATRYSDLSRYGTSATESAGTYANIEATISLADDNQKKMIAERLAGLIFDISA